ncbi:MAG TPA: hypothetical protein DDY13_13635 [Cytophagales bacterium]|nr:hypothetical protein [Cytophagales bacterium]
MKRNIILAIILLSIFMTFCKNDKRLSSDLQTDDTRVVNLDTVYLTNPKFDSSHKQLIISISSHLSQQPVKLDAINEDTIKIEVIGISTYPIIIKEEKNVSFEQINDSLFFIKVLDTTKVYFEIWQDYGKGNVISKIQNSTDSVRFVPYDGIRPVGRIMYP